MTEGEKEGRWRGSSGGGGGGAVKRERMSELCGAGVYAGLGARAVAIVVTALPVPAIFSADEVCFDASSKRGKTRS